MLDPQGFSDVADRDMEDAALVAAIQRLVIALVGSGECNKRRVVEIGESVNDALDAHNATGIERLFIYAGGAFQMLETGLRNRGISVPKQ